MKLFNPTYEKIEIQHDSRVYTFTPQGECEVPEYPTNICSEILDRTRHKGIFLVTPGMSPKDFKAAKREALKLYLEGELSTRIMNFNSYKDALDKAGKTMEEDYTFLKAKRWKKEIAELINYEEQVMGEESFLEKKEDKQAVA